ncbi:hypothetical protein LCGC14_2490070, partial [marine sediment metagenome]
LIYPYFPHFFFLLSKLDVPFSYLSLQMFFLFFTFYHFIQLLEQSHYNKLRILGHLQSIFLYLFQYKYFLFHQKCFLYFLHPRLNILQVVVKCHHVNHSYLRIVCGCDLPNKLLLMHNLQIHLAPMYILIEFLWIHIHKSFHQLMSLH